MKYGLTDSEFNFFMKTFVEPMKKLGVQVFIFGSRASGNQQKFSDIDLLYKNNNSLISKSEIYKLLSEMEDSSFPYKIDLVDDNDLAHSYRTNIERQLIEL